MQPRSRTAPRKIPRQSRSRETVDAIVAAAAHLLASRGWVSSTTNHIAARAGVSIGSLYKYFPNKAAILAEVARRRIRSEVNAITAVLDAHATDPRGLSADLVAGAAERYATNAALDTSLMEQLDAIESAAFLRSAEASVVRHTARYLARQGDHLRSGEDVAFVAVHALRGLLVATAAHAPGKLRSAAFRAEVTRLLERHLAR